MNRSERRQAESAAKRKFEQSGMSADDRNPYVVVALINNLVSKLEAAKRSGTITDFVQHLYRNVELTRISLGHLAVACQNGCAHCCNGWVTSSAPEILHVAKIIRSRGAATMERVISACEKTASMSHQQRSASPSPCPLLREKSCSIYGDRPKACRMAASRDAEICFRSIFQNSNQKIPTPPLYAAGLAGHTIALSCALRRCGFPASIYEFNSGLFAALRREDSEAAWLAGEAVFDDALVEAKTAFDSPHTEMIYRLAFP